jgi:hypothetical protein
LLSTTRRYDAVRVTGATFALALAGCWILERLELVANPLAPLEDAAVGHQWRVAKILAVASLATWGWERRLLASGPPLDQAGTGPFEPRRPRGRRRRPADPAARRPSLARAARPGRRNPVAPPSVAGSSGLLEVLLPS